MRWSQRSTGKSVYFEIEPQDPQTNVEITQQAQDGKAYYAMATVVVEVSCVAMFPS